MEESIIWEDQFGKNLPQWHETYETEYYGLSVVLDAYILGNTIYAPEDVLRLKIYKDRSRTDFTGLQDPSQFGDLILTHAADIDMSSIFKRII